MYECYTCKLAFVNVISLGPGKRHSCLPLAEDIRVCRLLKYISGAEWHVSALDSCSFQSVVTPTESKLWLDTTREGRGTSITASDGGPRAGYTGLLSQVRRKPIRHADSRTTTSILKFGDMKTSIRTCHELRQGFRVGMGAPFIAPPSS